MKHLFQVTLFLLFFAIPARAGDLEDLFASVEALNIQRQGYTLCAKLTESQQTLARERLEKAGSDKVYRFRDQGLNIVADQATDRVLVMFEQFDAIGQQEVQNLVGDLFMTFDAPTVSAHDQVVYWAWGKKEKFTAEDFDTARQTNKSLAIIATVKLNSEIKIMDPSQADSKGNAYYIISSDPLLKFFQED